MLITRREIAWTVPWALLSPDMIGSCPHPQIPILCDWICRLTPKDFRIAIQGSGRFLYRGADAEDDDDDDADDSLGLHHVLQEPAPDLLLPETYNNDAAALAYFQCLETRLSIAQSSLPLLSWRKSNHQSRGIMALPSTGHIATSDPNEAGKWGPVVSVWPLGTEWAYAWPRDRLTLYDSESHQRTCLEDVLQVNRNLLRALQQPREVLFATGGVQGTRAILFGKNFSKDVIAPSAFLAIPQRYDQSIRERLELLNYGLS